MTDIDMSAPERERMLARLRSAAAEDEIWWHDVGRSAGRTFATDYATLEELEWLDSTAEDAAVAVEWAQAPGDMYATWLVADPEQFGRWPSERQWAAYLEGFREDALATYHAVRGSI